MQAYSLPGGTEMEMSHGLDRNLSRRQVLRTLGAGAALLSPLGRTFAADAAGGFFAARHLPIGLQLYTLGDAVRDDLEGTFEKIARIGYRVVEPAGWHGHTPRELRDAAARHGLKCTSVHVSAKPDGRNPALEGDITRLATDVHELGATDLVLSMFPVPARIPPRSASETFSAYLGRVVPQLTSDDWHATAALLNDKGATLRKLGLRLGYHNHNPEFAPLKGGTTGLEILLKETSTDTVVFQLDTGWAAAAGIAPEKLLARHAHRFQLMHLKDARASTKPNFTGRLEPVEIGAGKLDWGSLLPAAFESGVRKFYVEEDPPFTLDRFEAVARSFRHLSGVANVASGGTRA
jgi:sugar phosphate isomerase/epimerase